LFNNPLFGGGEREREAHFPISAIVKRSLRVPAVTQWNAALKKPVMKRKAIRMADGQKEYDN